MSESLTRYTVTSGGEAVPTVVEIPDGLQTLTASEVAAPWPAAPGATSVLISISDVAGNRMEAYVKPHQLQEIADAFRGDA